MQIKLGEILIRAGIISATELDEALKSQIIFGGRLGTNLIEMGCIEEERLARVLSEKLRVPFADPAALLAIPAEVIALIPQEVARKHEVVPLQHDGRRLTLVMADPSDLPAIDELAFLTGHVISPMVAPEVWLYRALGKYYGIKREVRALPVAKELGGRKARSQRPRTVDQPGPRPDVVDFSAIPGDEFLLLGVSLPPASPEEEAARPTVDSLSRKLADARDRDEIAAALVDYAGREFGRAALLLVLRDSLCGWEAVNGATRIAAFTELRIALDEPSVFAPLVAGGALSLGEMPETPANRRLAEAFGGDPFRTLLLVPLVINRRTVAILSVEGEPQALGARVGQLQMVVRKAVMALEILILRNKILMT